MTDYLGPLAIGTSGTYTLQDFNVTESDSGLTAAISVLVTSTTSDLLATAVDALAAQARQGNTYVHSQPGVTSPVVYAITKCDAFTLSSLPGDPKTAWQVFRQLVDLTLSLESRPAGALTTLYNAQAVNAPASLSLSALLGTHPPKLDVTIDDASGNDMHSVWAALAPTALTDAKWLVLASSLTWTTMSNGTGATMWGNTSRYTTSASWQTAPLDTSLYPAGKYRLLVRASQEAGTGYVMDSQNQTAIPITRTTQHLQVIGDVDLPVQDTAYGVASNLTFYVRSDGTNDCIVNAFVLLPLDLGYFFWHPDVATTEIDQLDVGPNGTFMDGVTDVTSLLGGTLEPKTLAAHTGTLVATASPTGSTWPTDWGRTDSTYVTADTSRIKCVGASEYAWYAATNAATPLIVPDEWYELSFTRDVDSYVAGNVTAQVVWQDLDGNTVRSDTLSSVAANDASPTAVTVYGKAPAHAARAQVKLGTDGTGNVTVYWSAVSFNRCPLRLIIVAEDAAGELSLANGGTITMDGAYTVHKFTTSGTFIANVPINAEVLRVGGGGGGLYGGGGGGGVITGGNPTLTQVAADGTLIRQSCPAGVYYSGRTYFAYLSSAGAVAVNYYDHATRTIGTPYVAKTWENEDYHGVPAITVDGSGYFTIAYSLHGSTMYSRRSTNPGDISAWGAEVTIDGGACNYPQFHWIGSTLRLFYRLEHGDPPDDYSDTVYRDSANGGASWGAATTVVSSNVSDGLPDGRVYARTVSLAGELHMFLFVTQLSDMDDIFHIYLDGSDWKEFGGAALSLPVSPSDLTPIYTSATHEASWVDAGMAGAGDPRCLAFDGTAGKYLRYTGGNWVTQAVTADGLDAFDAMTLDASDPDKLVAAGPTHITELLRTDGGFTVTDVLWTGDGTPFPFNVKAVEDAHDGVRFIAPLWDDLGDAQFLNWVASLWIVTTGRVLLPAGSYPVVVGDGGGAGEAGEDTTFASRTAEGGGAGGAGGATGGSGGSGGGGGVWNGGETVGGAGTPGQGYDGGGNANHTGTPYPAGGGGGAGGVGGDAADDSHAGNGGPGINSDIVESGVNVGYGGGGGAGLYTSGGTGGVGTHGGGSVGGVTYGAANTGGGGAGGEGGAGSPGGSGIVVIRYLITDALCHPVTLTVKYRAEYEVSR